jgi:ABC-type Mn2+/Zn2+ transport system ATPase subunit
MTDAGRTSCIVAAMSDCLSMRGVWKTYEAGVRGCSASVSVLRDVHLDVLAGEMVGVIAGAASGKSTLLLCASGLLRPDRGSVAWFGRPARRDPTSRPDGIAYAGDRPFPYGFLTIREALEYAAIVRDLPVRDGAERVGHALEHTGLSGIAHRRVDAVDGGALARLAIAGALLARPRLLLVDDLATGLDGDTAATLIALLCCLARDGAGVVVAGRLVTRLATLELPAAAPETRFVTLASGRIETTAERPAVAARRAAATLPTGAAPDTLQPIQRARVAELSPPPTARENGAR